MADLHAGRTVAVVLAAGKGTRMKTDLPKVLVEVRGRPLIAYVLDALRAAGVDHLYVVVGYRAEAVRAAFSGQPDVSFVEQTQQLGTGHAVMVCGEALAGHDGAVVVVTGDSPMLQSKSVACLVEDYWRDRPACVMGTVHKDDPAGLGRIVRDDEGRFQAIVEEKDATPDQRRITEVNMSTYVFDCRELFDALDHLKPNNVQGEYYITDCPQIMSRAGKLVQALAVLDPVEALSINTVDELGAVEAALREMDHR